MYICLWNGHVHYISIHFCVNTAALTWSGRLENALYQSVRAALTICCFLFLLLSNLQNIDYIRLFTQDKIKQINRVQQKEMHINHYFVIENLSVFRRWGLFVCVDSRTPVASVLNKNILNFIMESTNHNNHLLSDLYRLGQLLSGTCQI